MGLVCSSSLPESDELENSFGSFMGFDSSWFSEDDLESFELPSIWSAKIPFSSSSISFRAASTSPSESRRQN